MESKSEVITEDITKVECKKFDILMEAKMLKSISKILEAPGLSITEEQALSLDLVAVPDRTMVTVIKAKTEEAKRFLSRFIELEQQIPPIDQLDWNCKGDKEIKSQYPIEYMDKYLNFFKCMVNKYGDEDGVTLKILPDYPMSMENQHFQVIIAPRVE